MFLKGQLVVDKNRADGRGIPPKINYQLFVLRYINDQDGRPQSVKPPITGPQLGSAQSHRQI